MLRRGVIEVSPVAFFTVTFIIGVLVVAVAGSLILGGEKIPGLEIVGYGLGVVYAAGIALIAIEMENDRHRGLFLIRIPFGRSGPTNPG